MITEYTLPYLVLKKKIQSKILSLISWYTNATPYIYNIMVKQWDIRIVLFLFKLYFNNENITRMIKLK